LLGAKKNNLKNKIATYRQKSNKKHENMKLTNIGNWQWLKGIMSELKLGTLLRAGSSKRKYYHLTKK
jgi:hypothetical protein